MEVGTAEEGLRKSGSLMDDPATAADDDEEVQKHFQKRRAEQEMWIRVCFPTITVIEGWPGNMWSTGLQKSQPYSLSGTIKVTEPQEDS